MNKKQKKMLLRIIIAAALFLPLTVISHIGILEPLGWWAMLLFLLPYGVVAYDVLISAARNISRGHVFDENFLMTVATFGAFATGEFPEAVAVMLFYQVGELFQSCAVAKSRSSIAELMDICPEFANLESENGGYEQVDPEDVNIGDIIVVLPGERIPLDGVVIMGSSLLDTSALTGESAPRRADMGDSVLSGCVNGDSLLKIRVTKPYCDSTAVRILELVEEASDNKAKVENFITRFARYYTPIVVIAAALLALIPPIFDGAWSIWPIRACTFLVISCPCALVISVPLTFFSGIGAASKNGILVKGSNFLELLSYADAIAFDKTGTLTQGVFEVTQISPEGVSPQELLRWAALAESYSTHPIARSVIAACPDPIDPTGYETEEMRGYGVYTKGDHEILAGNIRLMEKFGIALKADPPMGTSVYVALDGRYIGSILISDRLKEDAAETIARLKKSGLHTSMLTGDRSETAGQIAGHLGLDEVYSELLPQDKVTLIEKLISQHKKVCYVGDGINDAPVIARADIGIAMGSMGSDAAIEAADIVIMDDKPSRLVTAIKIAKKTVSIVHQNIWFALGIKGLFLILGPLGIANMWWAVFADVGVAVIAILNAMRAFSIK